ncbi:MAG: hypothetical protein V4718_00550 [Pseudomonadota bacterium]
MTTLLAWLWMLFVVAPLLLLLLYAAGIQYQAGGICKALLPVVLVAWLLDVLLNWTVFVIYTSDCPSWQRREFTLSQRLARLIAAGGVVGSLCWLLACTLNALCPGGVHVSLEGRS